MRQHRCTAAPDPSAGIRRSTTNICAAPGLDYHEYATLQVHDSLAACLQSLPQSRLFAFTTKASHPYHEVQYQAGDAFLFGPESRGLPKEVLDSIAPERRLRLPMLPDNRSLNLSNTVAVAVFEAWRQCNYAGSQSSNSLPG